MCCELTAYVTFITQLWTPTRLYQFKIVEDLKNLGFISDFLFKYDWLIWERLVQDLNNCLYEKVTK